MSIEDNFEVVKEDFNNIVLAWDTLGNSEKIRAIIILTKAFSVINSMFPENEE